MFHLDDIRENCLHLQDDIQLNIQDHTMNLVFVYNNPKRKIRVWVIPKQDIVLPNIQNKQTISLHQKLEPTRAAASVVEIINVKKIKLKMIIYRLRYFAFDHHIIEKY